MKKNLKKLELNKKAISNLTHKINGGAASTFNETFLVACTNNPTALTWCYICPIDPIKTIDTVAPIDTVVPIDTIVPVDTSLFNKK
ncbi:MAG: hypothetical protein AAF611_09245 [Bacteroidota bacterium]